MCTCTQPAMQRTLGTPQGIAVDGASGKSRRLWPRTLVAHVHALAQLAPTQATRKVLKQTGAGGHAAPPRRVATQLHLPPNAHTATPHKMDRGFCRAAFGLLQNQQCKLLG